MKDIPVYTALPVFGGSSTKVAPPAPYYDNGYSPDMVLPAQHANYFWGNLTNNSSVADTSTVSTVTELKAILTWAGMTPDGSDSSAQILTALKRLAKENVFYPGSLHETTNYIAPTIWNAASPDSYFPAICLTTISGYSVVTSAQAPAYVTYKRASPVIWAKGLAGEKTDFGITAYSITSNVATLTFENTTEMGYILAALQADATINGGYSNWVTFTNAAAIGPIVAGDYAITAISTGSRTISFAYTNANTSGSGSWTGRFYPHRIPGSTTSCRVYEHKARANVSANDTAGRYIANLRTADQFQGHYHQGALQNYASSSAYTGAVNVAQGNGTYNGAYSTATAPITDGADGIPRVGPTTDVRALSVYVYEGMGALIA